MTETSTHDDADPDLTRHVPPLGQEERTEFLGPLRDPGPGPWALVQLVSQEDAVAIYGDANVFATVSAVQLVDGEPWLVRAVLGRVETRPPILKRVAVEHLTDRSREVTGAAIRDINFGGIRTAALAELRGKADALGILKGAGWDVSQHELDAARSAAEEGTKGGHRGVSRVGLDHYRHIAVRYLALVDSGRHDVLNALREEESARLGYEVKRGTLRDWLRKATERGFLSSGTKGRAGRSPGPMLRLEHQKETHVTDESPGISVRRRPFHLFGTDQEDQDG